MKTAVAWMVLWLVALLVFGLIAMANEARFRDGVMALVFLSVLLALLTFLACAVLWAIETLGAA